MGRVLTHTRTLAHTHTHTHTHIHNKAGEKSVKSVNLLVILTGTLPNLVSVVALHLLVLTTGL